MSKNLGPLFVSESFQRLLQLDPDTNRTIIVGTGSNLGEIEFLAAVTASKFVGDGSGLYNISLTGTGNISSSQQVLESLVGQDLTVNSITAETIVISSSVTHLTSSYRSGSTISGDTLDDVHQFTGSVEVLGGITGSIQGDGSGLTNLVTGSVRWSDVVLKPFGIISSSGQTVANLNGTGIISSSGQTGSLGLGPNDTVNFGVLYVTHSSILGNLDVQGTLTAQQVVISSSVMVVTQSYSSGSTIFGDTADDTHQFTGSLFVSGNLTAENVTAKHLIFLTQSYFSGSTIFGSSPGDTHQFTGSLMVTNGITGSISASSVTDWDFEVSKSAAASGFGQGGGGSTDWSAITNKPAGLVSSSAQTGSVLGLGSTDTVTFGTVNSVHGNFTGNIIVDGTLTARQYVISSSVLYQTQSYSSGSTVFGDTQDDTHQFTGSVSITGSFSFDLIDGGTY